jgi:hypothetical protein
MPKQDALSLSLARLCQAFAGYLTERFLCMRFLVRVAATRMRSEIPVHSALAHTCEMGGGLRGVVNDLL